ncbi:hypothetical protein [Methyloglobulus sp.]|uniref:hypothetical protein n=1 Tax=Methyloglobulus sp. TaxID=2518622 RepID=UPI0032B863F4
MITLEKYNGYVGLLFSVIASFYFVGCNKGQQPPVTNPVSGSIAVNVGFGPVTNPPYKCYGDATVTLSSGQTTNLAFDNFSDTLSPACKKSVFFSLVPNGSYTVTVSPPGVTCPINVTGGNVSNVYVRTDAGACVSPWL